MNKIIFLVLATFFIVAALSVTKVIASLNTDLNGDCVVNIKDISIAIKAFGSYPGHERWNPLADINGDGKVDIRDIALIAKDFGKIAC